MTPPDPAGRPAAAPEARGAGRRLRPRSGRPGDSRAGVLNIDPIEDRQEAA